MTDTNEPALFSQLWVQVEPTILGEGATKTERINARTAKLRGGGSATDVNHAVCAVAPRRGHLRRLTIRSLGRHTRNR
jgi:hypothetical protein